MASTMCIQVTRIRLAIFFEKWNIEAVRTEIAMFPYTNPRHVRAVDLSNDFTGHSAVPGRQRE